VHPSRRTKTNTLLIVGKIRCQGVRGHDLRAAHQRVPGGHRSYVVPWPTISTRLTHAYTAFNPKPFIASFEAAVDQLIALRKDIQTKTEQIEKGVRVAEREYSKKMTELNRRFEVRVRAAGGARPAERPRQWAPTSTAWRTR
jgi:hypothetical protein